ncbi:MAG: hypothetical protein M1827_003747 [Pycnora praestabilis]|nr:MAG: hypothetical protein M1827_003747 [Pycnora praestabilis]
MDGQGTPPIGGDRSRVGGTFGGCEPTASLSLVAVGLRIVTRKWISGSLGWDDAMIVVAEITNAMGFGITIAEQHWGDGRHEYYLSAKAITMLSELFYFDWLLLLPTLMFMKVSICLFLRRILATNKTRTRLLDIFIAVIIVFHVICFFIYFFQCTPIDAIWKSPQGSPNGGSPDGKCLSKTQIENLIIAQGSFSVFTDLICSGFPIIVLWDVKIPRRVKIALCGLMGLGVITAACSTVRTVLSGATKSVDQTWDGIDSKIWRCLECDLGVIAACMPPLYPFFKYANATIHRWTYKGTTDSGSTVPTYEQRLKPSKRRLEEKSLPSLPAGTDATQASGNQSLHLPLQNFSQKRDSTLLENIVSPPNAKVKDSVIAEGDEGYDNRLECRPSDPSIDDFRKKSVDDFV